MHSPILSKEKFISEVLRIGSTIIFHLSKLWKARVLHTVWCNISAEAAGQIRFIWPNLVRHCSSATLKLASLEHHRRIRGLQMISWCMAHVVFALRELEMSELDQCARTRSITVQGRVEHPPRVAKWSRIVRNVGQNKRASCCAKHEAADPAIGLSLSLPRVINFKFLLQAHQLYYVTQYEELGFS